MDNSSTSSGSSSVNLVEEHTRRAGKRIPKRKRSFDYEDVIVRKLKHRIPSGLEKLSREIIQKEHVRRNARRSRNKNRLSRIRRSIIDDNTTASDNSENTALFNEINWEENIEVDTSSLLDEFAPRPPVTSPGSDSHESLNVTESEVKEVVPVAKPKTENTTMQEKGNIGFEFTPGCHIHVMDYTTTSWLEGIIAEVDWEEEEVLVHYNSSKSDEWVSMNSQRLSKTVTQPTKSIVKAEVPIISNTKILTGDKAEPIKSNEPKYRRNIQILHRRSRRSRKELVQKRQHVSKIQDKFIAGEKVLAKWSDHRMQKFPAVIKRVLGHGQYDVLFYDGFEKTIMGDDLYKATEEEVEKYQQSNPSEADLLFPMDIGSKEERRQRKKKTFDDYLFEKDFQRSRKKPEVHSDSNKVTSSPISRKLVLSRPVEKNDSDPQKSLQKNKANKSLQRIELHKKRLGRKQMLLKIRARQMETVTRVKDPKLVPEKPTSSDSKVVKVNEHTKLYSSDCTPPEEASTSTEKSSPKITVPQKVIPNSSPLENERWSGDVPRDVYPIKVTGLDGILRKSVIVPDKQLPPGWTKHALLVKAGGNWDCFLVSPEGSKLRTMEEVKEYYNDLRQEEPPENLDLSLNMRTLPELVLKQNDLVAKGTCRKWDKKREKRRKSSQAEASTPPLPQVSHQVGRVRTLLPKYRTSSPINLPQPQSPATSNSAPESEVWRCPKQGCDKKFRKENLLQMHIKHYHVEFKALVGTAPNMVDLALARSENANSDWRQEQSRPGVIKRIIPKTQSISDKQFDNERAAIPPQPLALQTPLPSQAQPVGRNDTSGIISTEDKLLSKRSPPAPIEEKKTTIKTILPIRQPAPELPPKIPNESDVESDDDVGTELSAGDSQKLQANRLQKQSRSKKPKTDTKLPLQSPPVDDQSCSSLQGPKFIKKKPLALVEKLQVITDSNDSYTEEEKISPNTEMMDEGINMDRIRSEEVINCICGYREEDGLMIQCDICLCWQHGLCYGIENESEVPDRYVCVICQNPVRVRSSKKYIYAQQYLTQAKLPSLSFRTSKKGEINQREIILKRCYDISASLHQIQNVEHSLRAKINIAQQSDHPKLYLWAKQWDTTSNAVTEEKRIKDNDQIIKEENKLEETGLTIKTSAPEPEAPINLEDCRLRLLDHVEQYQHQIESRLTTLEAQIAALESQDPDMANEETAYHYPLTKQTVHMLLRDLSTIKKVATIN